MQQKYSPTLSSVETSGAQKTNSPYWGWGGGHVFWAALWIEVTCHKGDQKGRISCFAF